MDARDMTLAAEHAMPSLEQDLFEYAQSAPIAARGSKA
jgi:hypothetical protein